MGTLKKRIEDPREITDPNVVKVVTNRAGDAVYFSRCAIPFAREPSGGTPYFKHIGLYVYRRDFLLAYPALPVGPLEAAERLEQLRALENGFSIRVVETEYESLGVDTPDDLVRVSKLFDAALLQGMGNGYIHICNGRGGLFVGQGDRCRADRLPPGKPRAEDRVPEVRSVPEC